MRYVNIENKTSIFTTMMVDVKFYFSMFKYLMVDIKF